MKDNENILNDPAARYYKAHDGITKAEFMNIVQMTGLNFTAFSKFLPVSKRTIEKIKKHELMSPLVSDKALQIAALYSLGADTFDSMIDFKEWLESPLLALGGEKPATFLSNDTGLTLIRDLLGRIEYGVYS
jgi:putative toxin-antitoxin system antitoxin component (TIGR02293 family)